MFLNHIAHIPISLTEVNPTFISRPYTKILVSSVGFAGFLVYHEKSERSFLSCTSQYSSDSPLSSLLSRQSAPPFGRLSLRPTLVVLSTRDLISTPELTIPPFFEFSYTFSPQTPSRLSDTTSGTCFCPRFLIQFRFLCGMATPNKLTSPKVYIHK